MIPEAHREAERIAVDAEHRMRRATDDVERAEARERYEEAARLEETAYAEMSEENRRLRSLFALSAASLWFRAQRWEEVLRLTGELADAPLTSDASTQLKVLRAQAEALRSS